MSGNAMKLCNFACAILALLLCGCTVDAFHMISPEKAAETITTTTTTTATGSAGTTKITTAVVGEEASPSILDIALTTPETAETATKQLSADEVATTATTNDDVPAASIAETTAMPSTTTEPKAETTSETVSPAKSIEREQGPKFKDDDFDYMKDEPSVVAPKENANLTKASEKVTATAGEGGEEEATVAPKTLTTTSQQLLGDSSTPTQNDAPSGLAAGKMNIADLYPVRMEDFNPIIRDSNAELLKEHPVFIRTNNDEHRQNLMPNEVEDHYQQQQQPQQRGAIKGTAPSLNHAANPSERSSISDFTGKLLAEEDGIITEIEQKFRLHEEEASAGSSSTTSTAAPTTASTKRDKLSFSVNHQIHRAYAGQQFIDRRVKKSFEFPMHRVVSDGLMMQQQPAAPHVDFANTKFNTARHPPVLVTSPVESAGGAAQPAGLPPSAIGMHPEFSTTKFYNSKELYNEMMMHSHNNNNNNSNNGGKPKTMTIIMPQYAAAPPSASATTAGPKPMRTTEKLKFVPTLPVAKFRSFEHLKDFRPSNLRATPRAPTTVQPTTTTTVGINTEPNALPTIGGDVDSPAEKLRKIQKELKRAKLLLQTVGEPTTTARTTTQRTPSLKQSTTTTSSGQPLTMTATATDSDATPSGADSTANLNSPTAATLRPIARPRILRRLQEKINSLECEIQNVPQESHLWRGNETHELLLPIVETPEKCSPLEGHEKCSPQAISWEGEAEIQSGDVLIVEINDAQLTTDESAHINPNSAHNTQVYQVTRSGHEHCDVTEGILLDITPLVVDGRKLVTLYDKDLTEGVNLLIVVSDLWGSQCVRLKVTTKTDNCGDNADCSGKGVCYSNPAMEDYECQCCSGFAGPHCEEIDACTPSPCTNNGICVDLSQGHEGNSYQCLCPYGYSGKNCQYETDPCNPTECLNGGSCVGNSTHFRCDCTPGYTGPLCQHSLNECESSPCVHGICVDQEDGFRCFCQPGFAGELCNFEYNECESNPCQNNGECIDHIGSYECRCTKGYNGNRCQIKVDFCANKPCPDGHKCIDHGNEFSCQCPGGLNGLNCNQMPRTQCNVNPCTHGGTCWSSGDSFYCACRPGYTGTMCEDEFVVETVVSSSEFIVDDTAARNFNDKTFSSSVVLKSPIELHNAYFAAGVLAAAIFIVAIVVTICHCKVNQTYRKFSTRTTTFFPILGFGRRPKIQNKLNKHWLSGKSATASGVAGCPPGSGNPLRSSSSSASLTRGHLAATNGNQYTTTGSTALHHNNNNNNNGGSNTNERPFQRHLAMNLENDMYYTVDFSENSQHSPLIQ